MKDTNGKVILSLLAGAAAGAVAGLLLAPETGDQTRAGLKKSAAKWGGDLGKLLQDGLAKLNELKDAAPSATTQPTDRTAADDLLRSMGSGPDHALHESAFNNDSDYDGMGGDARHSAGYGKPQ